MSNASSESYAVSAAKGRLLLASCLAVLRL